MIGLVIRICKQMKNDKRSLGMMFVIPLVIITFLYFLLGNESANINVSLIGANDKITEAFEEAEDITVVECSDSDSVEKLLIAFISVFFILNVISLKKYRAV